MTNAIENARKALRDYNAILSDTVVPRDAFNLATALEGVLAVVEEARKSEERTHLILTDGRKPTREDSSKTWRILSGVES